MQIMGSILQPNILGTIQLSRGEAYLPHDKGNGAGSNKLAAGHFSFPTVDYNQVAASGRTPHFVGSLSNSSNNKWPQSPGAIQILLHCIKPTLFDIEKYFDCYVM